MIDYLYWHPSNGHVTSPSPEKSLMDKGEYGDHDVYYTAGEDDVDAGDGVVDDDDSMDLNIASNLELVSCSAFGGGGKAREAP